MAALADGSSLVVDYPEACWTISSFLKPTAGHSRTQVRLKEGNETLAVKIDNLLQMASVEITGVQNHPEYNGRKAKVIGEAADRLQVQLPDGRALALALDKLILENSTRVCVRVRARRRGVRLGVSQVRDDFYEQSSMG